MMSKSGTVFKQGMGATLKICGLAILLILAMSIVGFAANSAFGSGASTSTCSNAAIDEKILDAPVPVTVQNARDFTEASAQYGDAVKGYSSTFDVAATQWNIDSANCTVSWDSYAMNYWLNAANGSKYLLTVGANPGTDAIFDLTISPIAVATLPSNHGSSNYGGYAVATSSSPSTINADLVNYTTMTWDVPAVSNSSSPACGSTGYAVCKLDVWTGLQNSYYDGMNQTVAGEVVQIGTMGTCIGSSPCALSTWSQFVAGNADGQITQFGQGNCAFTISAGDEMYAVVGNQYAVNGTRGGSATYLPIYAIMRDVGTTKACKIDWSDSSSCPTTGDPSNTCSISGKEIFADYFTERPQDTSTGAYQLPVFNSPSDYVVLSFLGMTSTTQGAYTYYNDGYYFESHMGNTTVNTRTSGMDELGVSGHYGYFNETYVSSSGT